MANNNKNDQDSPMDAYPIDADEFNTKEARHANLLVDMYEGRQRKHLVDMLDGKCEGFGKRVEWRNRGIVPRTRNITKAIVDKSGLLFNRPPVLSIHIPNSLKLVTDENFNAIMESADWLEMFQNVDAYSRLLKSVVVLQQRYVPEDTITVNGQYRFDATNGEALLLTILHRGNSVVKMNPQRTKITALAFLTDVDSDGDTDDLDDDCWGYRLITPEEIVDVLVTNSRSASSGNAGDQKETIVNRQPNPDGFVPACFFYDINKPRSGYFVDVPEDIRAIQEMVNLHLTDLEFAVAWQKQKTAFVTGNIVNNDENSGSQVVPAAQHGFTPGGAVYNDIPFYQQKVSTSLGGLGSLIKLGLDDSGQAGSIKFEGPDTDLLKLQEVIDSLAEAVANDWDVQLKMGGQGNATSGFQLIVEEVANLNLRERRAQSMIAGLRRFYEITKQLYPNLLTEGVLQAKFAPPNLPVNRAELEQIWTAKIAANRATIVDYFMEVEGMTEAEALDKMARTIKLNNMVNDETQPPPAPVVAAEQAAEKPIRPFHTDSSNG
jgi:hypothetical protein